MTWENIYQGYQLFTAMFVHGVMVGFSGISFELHIITNLITIICFGVICERVLGPTKVMVLSISAGIVHILMRLMMNSFGTGISGISWPYIPIAFYIYLCFVRNEGKKVQYRPFAVIFLVLFLMAEIVVTVGNLIMCWHTSNLFHLAATIVGCLFLLVWKKDINSWYKQQLVCSNDDTLMFHKLSLWDKLTILVSLLGLFFLIKVVYSFYFNLPDIF